MPDENDIYADLYFKLKIWPLIRQITRGKANIDAVKPLILDGFKLGLEYMGDYEKWLSDIKQKSE